MTERPRHPVDPPGSKSINEAPISRRFIEHVKAQVQSAKDQRAAAAQPGERERALIDAVMTWGDTDIRSERERVITDAALAHAILVYRAAAPPGEEKR